MFLHSLLIFRVFSENIFTLSERWKRILSAEMSIGKKRKKAVIPEVSN